MQTIRDFDAAAPDATSPDAQLSPDAAVPCSEAHALRDPSTGHCFIRIQPALTWDAAKASCASIGAHLATLASISEEITAASLDDGTIADAWLGASDSAVEGDWRWLDNVDFPPSPTPNASSFQHWRAGEPNNSAAGAGEDCGVIELDNAGTWDDRSCTSTLSSICERE